MPKFNAFQKILVRDSENEEWVATFFSHYNDEGSEVAINDAHWKYCIPYEGNEDLVGTNRSKWEPKRGDLVAVRDNRETIWHLRIFDSFKIRDNKIFCIVAHGSTSTSKDQEWWDHCEPAKNHFEFNS